MTRRSYTVEEAHFQKLPVWYDGVQTKILSMRFMLGGYDFRDVFSFCILSDHGPDWIDCNELSTSNPVFR